MKKIVSLVVLYAFAFSSAVLIAHAEEKSFTVTVANDWNERQENVPVVLKISDLNCGFAVKSAIITEGGNEIPSQIDDLNGDSKADEIAFVTDMAASATKSFQVVVSSDKAQKEYPSRVYAEMLVSDRGGRHVPVLSVTIPGTSNIYNQMHHHGPAFESELTAYRIYFDQKQTVDIYGKFNKGLEIKESQFYPTDAQLARGFGDDVLLVGNSCGLGALKGWNGTSATHITPIKSQTESVLAIGPVRTVVDIISTDWQYQENILQMRIRYIQYAGHRDVEVQVSFDRPLQKEIFSTGVINIKESIPFSDHEGLVACWGTDWPVNDTVKYAKETVGLATCLPRELVVSEKHDRINYLYQIGAEGKPGFTYHITFTSMKETFGYRTPEAWFEHAKKWKQSLLHPCKVTIK